MKFLSKLAFGVSLFGGLVFSSPPQVDSGTNLPPRVELFLKGFERGLSLSLGEGNLSIRQKVVERCYSLLKGVIYNGTLGAVKISRLKISNLIDYPHWVEAEDIREIRPRGEGEIREITYIADKDSLIITFEGIENRKSPKEVGYIIPKLQISASYGENYGFATLKGFIKIPSLDSSYHYLSLESVGYADLTHKRGKVFLDGYFEGGGELKLTLLVENLTPQAVDEIRRAIDRATLGERFNLDKNSAIFSVVPKKLVLRLELEEPAKKFFFGDRELIGDLKTLSQLNGTMGTLARSLLDIAEGKAQGLKVEIDNKNGFNIHQLTAVFLLLSMAKTDRELEEIVDRFFDIKISTF